MRNRPYDLNNKACTYNINLINLSYPILKFSGNALKTCHILLQSSSFYDVRAD